MLVRSSLSPRRKCQTPSLWESRQPNAFRKSQNRYLKTEDIDARVVQSRNETKKVQNIVPKKNRSMSHHKQSLNSSFNARTIKQPTRKSSLQNRIQPISATHESNQQFQFSPSHNLAICQKLIDSKHYDQALKDLNDLEGSNSMQSRDVAFMKGMVLMNQVNYAQAVQQFQRAWPKSGEIPGQLAMLTAVAHKKLGNISEAVNALKDFISRKGSKGMLYDALIYKGKLLVKAKKFQSAMQDFAQACTLEQECSRFQGTLGKGDVLRMNGKYQEALNVFDQIPQTEQIIVRRILCYIEIQHYDHGMCLVNQLLDNDPNNSEALYLKAQIQTLQGQVNESLLSYEQCIKQNNSRKAVTKALSEIAKQKIEQRDFYAAFYTLQRAEHLEVDQEVLTKLSIFTEGVIFLMKRKYQEGVNNLTNLINNYQLGDFIKKIIFPYRAYGFICTNKYQKALNDLIYLQNFQELEASTLYNKSICEGIIMAQQNQFERAMSQFQKASKLFPGKMEPHFYKSMTIMQFIGKHNPSGKDKHIKNALKHLDKAVTLNDTNSNLLFHRGLLRFYFNQIDEALQDFNKAVEKNEDSVAKYFYGRGLVRACMQNTKQALNDFSIVISLDAAYAEAYLNRAKVYQILGDKNSAFNDLQKYVSLKPQDPEIHMWAGNLLFNIGAFEHAIKTYSHSNEIQSNVQLLKYRAQCYIIMKELNSAMLDLSRMIELTGDKKSYIDKEALLALKTASMGPEEAQQTMVMKLKESHKLVNYRLASQMLKKVIRLNSDGLVFKLADLCFYRGVMKFYMNNYKKAIDLWTTAYTLKQDVEHSVIGTDSQNSLMSQQERSCNELEELEFEERTFNMYEHYYNIAMATYMSKSKTKAKELLNQLAASLVDSYEEQIKDFIVQIDSGKPLAMSVFPFHNRLCCIFPTFKIGSIETRLSFCLPNILPPSMNPEFDKKLLENLQPAVVDNKPEAPWIRRNTQGVVFTDQIQQVELDLRSESQVSQVEQAQSEDPDEDAHQLSINEETIVVGHQNNMRAENYDETATQQTYHRKDFERLKQQLQLDSAVEQKLARLK